MCLCDPFAGQFQEVALRYGGGGVVPARVLLDEGRQTALVTVEDVGASLYDFKQVRYDVTRAARQRVAAASLDRRVKHGQLLV